MFKKRKIKENLNNLRTVEELYKVKNVVKEEKEKYEEDTYIELERLEKEMEKKINEILKNKEEVVDGQNIKKEYEETIKKINKNKEEMEKEKDEVFQRTEKMLNQLLEIKFYPPDYIFELNMVRGLTMDIEENVRKNPIKKVEFEERTKNLEEQIEKYMKLHEEVLEFIKENEGTKEVDIIEMKEELSRDLQMGRLEEIEEKLKKIKKH